MAKQKLLAIIQNGTTSNEKVVIGRFHDICYRAQHAGLSNPAIVIVGDVVALQLKQPPGISVSIRNVMSTYAAYNG
jgi:siroheme synthase